MTTTATQRGAPPPPPPQSARSTPSDQTQATTSTPSTPNTPGMPRHSDIDQEHIDKRHSDTTTAPAQATATKIALDQTTQVRPRAARQVTSRRANQQTTMQARRRHDAGTTHARRGGTFPLLGIDQTISHNHLQKRVINTLSYQDSNSSNSLAQ